MTVGAVRVQIGPRAVGDGRADAARIREGWRGVHAILRKWCSLQIPCVEQRPQLVGATSRRWIRDARVELRNLGSQRPSGGLRVTSEALVARRKIPASASA